MKVTKWISMIMMAVFLAGAVGCNQNSKDNTDGNGDDVTFTDFILAEKGKSEYSVIIPENASEYETFAAEELHDLFLEATGAELAIYSDNGRTFSDSAKYISISDTKVFKESGVEADYAVYKESGTRLKNVGSCVILTGASDEGALYAVYDFLNILFDYEYYDVDAYRLNKSDTVKLPVLDVSNIPDNDYRMYGDYLQEDKAGGSRFHAYRLRYKVYGQGYAIDGHAATILLDPKVYGEEHSEWFSKEENPDHRQLCYMNDGMREAFLEKVKAKLTEKPEATIISVAQADYNTWCDCKDCTETIKKYGNGVTDMGAVTQILFLNWLVPEVDEWLAVNFPGRNVKFMVLAYHKTVEPPAHKDSNGNYVPNDEAMILNDKVIVQYASIYANRNLSFKDNPTERERLKAWSAVSSGLYIYEYPQDALNVCLPYDGLHVFADNLRFSKELGFSSYFMQGNFNTQSSGFTELKVYVASKLMWDSSLNPNELAYDYIENVYGEAAPVMKEFFDALRTRLAYLRNQYNYGSFVLNDGLSTTYWPRNLMVVYQSMFDEAYAAIDSLQYIDEERYEVLFRKIKIEEMFVKYVNCSLYLNRLTTDEKNAAIDDFEYYAKKYGFKNWSESKPMSDRIAEWRNS